MSVQEFQPLKNLYDKGYCYKYIKTIKPQNRLWQIVAKKLAYTEKKPCFNSEEEKNENSEEAMSKYKKQIDVMIRNKECVKKIKKSCNGKPVCLAIVNAKLTDYKDPCVKKDIRDIEMQIDGIGRSTEKYQLDVIAKLAYRFDFTRELFEKRYNAIQKRIIEDIKKIDLSTSENILSIVDEQAANYRLGNKIATEQYFRILREARQLVPVVQNKINALTKRTAKEYRQILKKYAEGQDLGDKFSYKIAKLKESICKDIASLEADTDRAIIISVKISASNYDLNTKFDQKYTQVQAQIKLKLGDIKPDTPKKDIDALDIQARNYHLGNNIATAKQTETRINALVKSSTKRDIQALEQKAISNNLIKEFNNKVDGIKEEIKKDIEGLNADTEDSAILFVERSTSNYGLKGDFDKRYNFIKNEIQTQIDKIDVATNAEAISNLNTQGEHYNLGKDAATKRFNQVVKINATKQKIITLDASTSKEDRQIIKKEAEQSKLTNEYDTRIKSIKTDIRDKMSLLTIDSDKEDIKSVKTYADNYNLNEIFKLQYEIIQTTIKENINKIDSNIDAKTLFTLNQQAENYDLGKGVATAKHDQAKKDAKKIVIETGIKNLIDKTAKEDRQELEQQAADNNLTNVFNAKIYNIKKGIKKEIANLNINTDKTEISSIRESATNYDLKEKLDEKFKQIKNQIEEKIKNIKPDTHESDINALDVQAKKYDLGENVATIKFNEIKDDKYLKFIELQDNTAIKTIFKSEECFEIFELQDIQICLEGMNKRVASKAKVDQCNKEHDCMYQKPWMVKRDHYIRDPNNFLKICLDEFAAEQFVPCNGYDSKKAISSDIQDLDIQIQAISTFNSEKCFSVFTLENIKMCLRGTKIQILPKSSTDICNNPEKCVYSPSWSISTDENLSSFEGYLQICKEEFENKNFISCDDQFSSWLDLSLIMKLGFTTIFLIGMMYMCKDRLPFLAGAGQLPLEEQQLIGIEGMQDHDNTAFIER